jgi:hypothetical protein
MRRITEIWPSQWRRKRPPRTVYVGSHEDRLSRIAPMHIDPDDDGRTAEDVAAEKAESRRGAGSGGPVFYS